MSVLWYFPSHRWGMAPGSALEIPRCCRYGDQPPLYLTLGDRYRVPLAFAFPAQCKRGDRIFDSSVERAVPSFAAAPDGPNTRPWHSRRAASMISFS